MIGQLALAFLAVDLGPGAVGCQRHRSEDVIQPQAVVLREGQCPVVPPRVQMALGMLLAMNVDEPQPSSSSNAARLVGW